MASCRRNVFVFLFAMMLAFPCWAELESDTDYRECNLEKNQIRKQICHEDETFSKFSILPYKPLYILLFTYDEDLDESGNIDSPNTIYDETELKFQLSFKSLLLKNDKSDFRVYAGYTQLSYWQLYNKNHSRPFRETNYEPEFFALWLTYYHVFGNWSLDKIKLGLLNHHSNGQSQGLSRSWNRSYLQFTLSNDPVYIDFMVWGRWSEDDKVTSHEARGDDNPDIEKYYGKGEIKFMWYGCRFNHSFKYRNNFEGKKNETFEFTSSYPVSWIGNGKDVRLYFQYYKGYGESLIDYNVERERIGIGFILTEWL